MKTLGSAALLLLAAGVAGALWVQNCSGPRPTVDAVQVVAPTQAGDPYRVRALIRNQGSGEGQVDVVLRLREPGTGRGYQADEKAELQPGEASWVSAEIAAPPAEYGAEAEAQYPP